MYTKLFIFVTLFCSLWQPSYISDAVRLQMRLNNTLTVLEYEIILIVGTVYQGTYCTFILNLFDLFSHVAFTFSQNISAFMNTSLFNNIQEDFILSDQLIKL
jgi:hypothetical protein